MKRTESFVVIIWLCFTFLVSAEAQTPNKQQDEPAKSTIAPEALSAEFVDHVSMGNKTWEPPDPSKNIGVIVVIKLVPNTSYRTEEFALVFKSLDQEKKAICRGYSAGMWFLTNEEGEGWVFSTGGKAAEIEFIFVIPKDVSEVRLSHKGQLTGKTIKIKRQ